tara:strand:+ start:803 stop:1522 length:720 start_codon:yes stop_codon:yes gene_type:complete
METRSRSNSRPSSLANSRSNSLEPAPRVRVEEEIDMFENVQGPVPSPVPEQDTEKKVEDVEEDTEKNAEEVDDDTTDKSATSEKRGTKRPRLTKETREEHLADTLNCLMPESESKNSLRTPAYKLAMALKAITNKFCGQLAADIGEMIMDPAQRGTTEVIIDNVEKKMIAAAHSVRDFAKEDDRMQRLLTEFEENELRRKEKKPRAPRARVVHDADSLKALFASLPPAQQQQFMAQLTQ